MALLIVLVFPIVVLLTKFLYCALHLFFQIINLSGNRIHHLAYSLIQCLLLAILIQFCEIHIRETCILKQRKFCSRCDLKKINILNNRIAS